MAEDSHELEDPEDVEFLRGFARLRDLSVRIVHGLTGRIQERVAEVERPPPSMLGVLFGGLVELLNVVSRLFDSEETNDE